MPLEHSSSPGAFKRNVRTLMGEVGKSPHIQSREQALAISYAIKRRGHADGGVAGPDPSLADYFVAGAKDFGDDVVNAVKGGGNLSQGPSFAHRRPLMDKSSQNSQSFSDRSGQMFDGRKNGGVTGLAGGGPPPADYAPWFERQEARNMHQGPILSSVPGRTDNHPLTVASGSYVIPSQHIAALGQGNSLAGMSVLRNMFSKTGPYGSGPTMSGGRGMGAPKAPPLPKFGVGGSSDKGGARGEESGSPVEIMAAGGEWVVPPEVVKRIGKGSLKHGHAILDSWIMKTRKKDIKVQQKLPPPAKR